MRLFHILYLHSNDSAAKIFGKQIFQRSYHDHIIRNEQDYLKIWEYIDNNPTKWKEDCFYEQEP